MIYLNLVYQTVNQQKKLTLELSYSLLSANFISCSQWITLTSLISMLQDPDTEEMVSGVSLRAVLGYLNSDDLPGLKGEENRLECKVLTILISAFLVNVNVQIDETDDDGWSSLIHACVLGKTEAALTILDNAADIDLTDNEGCSALHHAARESKHECCKLLIERGAKIDVKDSSGWTPFLWSCYVGNVGVADTLLSAGADVNALGLHHCTGLIWAAGKNNVDMVRLLLHHGAKVDTGDKYGTTPLIWVTMIY